MMFFKLSKETSILGDEDRGDDLMLGDVEARPFIVIVVVLNVKF